MTAEQLLSPAMSLTRIAPVVRARTRRLANRALGLYDTRSSGVPEALQTPILIVGAPRSGSTLLYQVMVERFDVAYISNRHCRWHGAPSLVERRVRGARHTATYSSQLGVEAGDTAPSECGGYWYRFFPRTPHHVPLEAADAEKLNRLRRSVARFGAEAGRPIVFKNLYCSLRLEPIAAALPEALFLVIERDLLDNARSLLASRMRRSGGYAQWWSAEPPGIERLRALPPEQQVVEQVRGIAAAIASARESIGADRFLDLSYESLCEDPAATTAAIAAFCARHGTHLKLRGEIPARFDRTPGAAIDGELESALERYVRRG
jgi:hypothetical protein